MQPELCVSSIPQCHFRVIQIWAVCLQPGFPIGPDPNVSIYHGVKCLLLVFQPRVGLHWYTARGSQKFDNNSTGMCYLRLWDSLFQNVMEINNLARFILGSMLYENKTIEE